ncbi:Branched-chain amino acid transport system / permease component [Pigmentiphaga humi]|uniref:Branched-chain amino acid transport system / permease component n=1 Tax=Pigmentiphaga humi TaxID=2478468 RepID=A0A3P4B2B5_9BURK|nr:ABC transporter permease [Pigmentiphaga humi]VCU69778.1 Branched-chain amino acid transport system / permease component [Pigmentiphaga humi]
MLRLEPRGQPSRLALWLSPLAAMLLTLAGGGLLFTALGIDAWQGLRLFVVEPFADAYALGELAVKATPLALCAVGLALCFRANMWNIGAEGQLIAGAIAGGGIALLAGPDSWPGYVIAVMAAGMLGGMAWAALTAWLKDRYGANEMLVSLMLAYVAHLLLGYLVFGPWRDPYGFNFPQSRPFDEPALLPVLWAGTRAHAGAVLAVAAVALAWLFLARSQPGFRLRVVGAAPAAARYAGYAPRRALWTSMLACGALAGLAGVGEVAGPMQRLTTSVSPGYGFAAVIAVFLGRLHPVGTLLASVVMAALYIGGELAQSRLGLPASIVGVFQGLALALLLLGDTLVRHRVRWRRYPGVRA